MNRLKHCALYALIGGAGFWVTDVLIIGWYRLDWVSRLWRAISVWLQAFGCPCEHWLVVARLLVPPLVVCAGWYALSRQPPHSRFHEDVPLSMLLGIWLALPLGMHAEMLMFGARSHGGRGPVEFLRNPGGFILDSLVRTVMTGSFFAIALATVLLLAAAGVAAFRRRRAAHRASAPA